MMKKKILVVDNHPLILKYMANLLEKEGHQVKVAEDGLSALDVLKTYIPDIIFIDLVMPNINGAQLCRMIRKNPALKGSYVVILSATIAENSTDINELGAHAFIVKGPFDRMATHVIAAIAQSETHVSISGPEEIMGSKGVYKRFITRELISAKGHLEKILSAISEGILEISPAGRIVFANAAAVDFMGSSEEALLGANFASLIPEGDRLRIEALLYKIAEGSDKATLDGHLVMNSRLFSVSLLRVQENGASSAVVVLRDVTDVIKAEEHQRLTQVIDFLPDATMVIDLEGRVIAWNRAIEKMTGIKAQDILGKGDYEYAIPFYGERRPVLIDLVGQWDKAIEEKYEYVQKVGDELISETFDPLIKPGGYLWNKASMLYDGDGKVIGAIESIRDISDMKNLEAQLRQAQKMEALGTLAGGIAHDFNNLLMAIQGHTSLTLMNKDSSHPDFEHLCAIEGHVENAVTLTRQLLGFARGGKYEVRPTDLNALVQKQNEMFGRTRKEITINSRFEENLWAVEVDRGQIGQVLLNLYVNAWQAMPEGGHLYVETENVNIGAVHVKQFSIQPGRYVKISVRDTGTGMDEGIRDKIFDPFFTTKEMGRGTGLGLASAYGIIKNHSGFIHVYSEKGCGSIFNVYLPASEKKVMAEKQQPAEVLKGGGETLLVVDDEAMIVEIAQELLRELGYQTLTAGGGKEALRLYESHGDWIDLVILDMVMPDMSGGEVFDRLKHMNPAVKVLLSSGYSIDGAAREIVIRGCNGFIQKPYKIKELSQKLREILDEKPMG